jgi:PAS domain S-box-containing protein
VSPASSSPPNPLGSPGTVRPADPPSGASGGGVARRGDAHPDADADEAAGGASFSLGGGPLPKATDERPAGPGDDEAETSSSASVAPKPREPAPDQPYRTLFEQAPVGMFLFDTAQRITDCNARFAEILRSPRDRLVGLDLRLLRDESVLPAIEDALRGESAVFEGPYFATQSAARLFVTLRASPVRDRQGIVVGGVGLLEDNTDRVLMQARLLTADRMVSIGTLAAGVAHEVNNPLAYVLANIDGVRRKKLPHVRSVIDDLVVEASSGSAVHEASESLADIEEMLRIARDGADRVRTIVGDLKTFSRGDDASRAPVDVRRVLDVATNIAWNEIRQRASFVKSFSEVPLVLANDARLGQVFLNLLLNAVQALDGTSNDPIIGVRVFSDDHGRAVVEVGDTGVGVTQDSQARVFDPFFTTKDGGTGLGLWIAQSIVSSLGGQIALLVGKQIHNSEAPSDYSTVFRVTLPPVVSELDRSARTLRRRVLVVDDALDVTNPTWNALADEHDVVVASSGTLGLSLIRKDGRFDVILHDPSASGPHSFAECLADERPDLVSRLVSLDTCPRPFTLDAVRDAVAERARRA